jgi:hypothetical protein
MTTNVDNDGISYVIEEINNNSNDFELLNIDDLMNQMDDTDELTIPHIINYHENFTVKEILIICEYYGFAKDIKANKFNKEQIINYLVSFENDIKNSDIVFRRKNMWFYMDELKNDKFMKKYILW